MKLMVAKDNFQEARQRMVAEQIISRGVNDERVLEAMRTIPRHLFVDEDYFPEAYYDHPLPIGDGQTISQPYIVALMTSCLELKGTEKVLEIGTGSGYQAAILAVVANEVHTVERVPRLAEKARRVLDLLNYKNIQIHVGDGSLGWPECAPYDCIITTAAAPEVPEGLIQQMKIGGRMVIPVGSRWRQMLEVWQKTQQGVKKEEVLPVVFVPLLGAKGWQDSQNFDED